MPVRLLFAVLVVVSLAGAQEPRPKFESATPERPKLLAVVKDALTPEGLTALADLLDRADELRDDVVELFRTQPKLREAFAARYGDEAKAALAKANSPNDLLAVVRRYEPTEAGVQALAQVLAHCIEKNRTADAHGAVRLLRRYRDKVQAVPPPEPAAPLPQAPDPRVVWSMPLTRFDSAVERVQADLKALRERGAVIPLACRPEFVPGIRSGIVWSSHEGLHQHALTGERMWAARSWWSLDSLFRNSTKVLYAATWHDAVKGTPALLDNTRMHHITVGPSHVYRVDDVVLRPATQPVPKPGAMFSPVIEILEATRLQAFARSGKLTWEVGGREGAAALKDGYFLGAPLVVGNTLLVLHEKARTLYLARLDANTGELLQRRELGTVTVSLGTQREAARRAHHLRAIDDLVIVPTGCGELIAVDLPLLRVRWRYRYETGSGPGIEYRPHLSGGRLIYSGPDTRQVHALDLATGKPAWTAATEAGDQFLSGLLVIGSKSVRALHPDTGATEWRAEVGRPAGTGYVGAGGVYYHPVARDGLPDEVLALDLKTGVTVARILMPADLRLGNLVSVGERVVSVGAMEMTVFATRLLLPLPDNVRAGLLTVRELLTQKKPTAAVEQVLALHRTLPLAARPALRELYFEALTEIVRGDKPPGAALDAYRELIQVPIPADAPADVQLQLRSLRAYREAVGVPLLVNAYRSYGFAPPTQVTPLEFALALLRDADDRCLQEGSLAGILNEALRREPRAVVPLLSRKATLANLPRLVALLSPETGYGGALHLRYALQLREVDRQPAERLLARLATEGHHDAQDAALWYLAEDALKRTDAAQAGRYLQAIRPETMARLADAWSVRDLRADLVADKRLLPYLDPAPVWAGPWQVEQREERVAVLGEMMRAAEPLPPWWPARDVYLGFQPALSWLDRATGKVELLAGERPVRRFLEPHPRVDPIYVVSGRVILTIVQDRVLAVDPVARVQLWTYPLRAEAEVNDSPATWRHPHLGRVVVRYPNGWTQVAGEPVACQGNVAAVRTQRGIVGLDVTTGQVRWMRPDLRGLALLHRVGARLLVLSITGDRLGAARWLALEDGTDLEGVAEIDFAHLWQLDGKWAVTVKPGAPRGEMAAVNLETGTKRVWSPYPGSWPLVSRAPGYAGWLDPLGGLRVYDYADNVLELKLELPLGQRGGGGGTLLADGQNFYLVTRRVGPRTTDPDTPIHSESLAAYATEAADHLLAIDRKTGARRWAMPTRERVLLTPWSLDLPILILGSREAGVVLLDRATGKAVHDKPTSTLGGLRWDAQSGKLELLFRFARWEVRPSK